MKADLEGQVALVFGSSSGIGEGIAIKLAENGADIVLSGRRRDPPATVEQINHLGRRVEYEAADIMHVDEVRRAVDAAIGRMGRIDIMVASGGITGLASAPKFFLDTDPADFMGMLQSQWLSRLYAVKAVLPYMISAGRGKILLIGGDAGRWPTPAETLPGSAHAALYMATRVIALETIRHGIRVNALSMPPIPGTSAFDHVVGLSPSIAHVFAKAATKPSFSVTPDDLAEAALFLCSRESDAITGQVLSVNGGLSLPG